jgi:hypothetical protein
MKGSNWKHSMYRGNFLGTYERDKRGERVFVLKGNKNVTFESHEAAKRLGWKKVSK